MQRGEVDGDGRGGRRRGDAAPEEDELALSWRGLGSFLKGQCGGAEAYLLCGNPRATQALKLRADARFPLTVGGVDCRLLKYGITARAPAAAPP
jgi:putative N6-adenine-specific DNA methylase